MHRLIPPFSYDPNGNLTSKSVTQNKATEITGYQYDYHNILTKVTNPDGTMVSIQNLNDGFDRFSKTTNAGTIKYFHDGYSVLAEHDQIGNQKVRYTLGPNIDEIIARKDSTGTYFYHYDGLGSVAAITDKNGKVAAKYDYEPFGRFKETTGSTINNPYTFTGREYDSETGLYFYRARYYDAKIGRFVSEDPLNLASIQLPLNASPSASIILSLQDLLILPAKFHLYVYAGNNPVNLIDPTGEVECSYTITGRTLTCTTHNGEAISCYAMSGNNNPADQCVRNVGPIPTGAWE